MSTPESGALVSSESTIGIALIVKDDAAGLRHILTQLTSTVCDQTGRSIFDQIVVEGQTDTPDDVVAIGMEFGVTVHRDYRWIDDFGDKRRTSFARLTTDWLGWCDTDDEWLGLPKLRQIIGHLEAAAPQKDAIWCLYYYDRHVESNQSIAEHQRERFVKRGSPWQWKPDQEVHEHMVVEQGQPIEMAYAPGLQVLHQRDTSIDGVRNTRNIRILRKAKRKRPQDARIYFDLGSQYYHTARWGRAVACYRHFTRLATGPVERYQALHRMADCYRLLATSGQQALITRALACEREAIALIPTWQDAWYGLSEVAMLTGDWRMTLNYAAIANPELFGKYAQTLDKPAAMLVLNQLDYNLHAMVPVHRALGALGRLEEALDVVDQGLAIVPQHPELIAAKNMYGTQVQMDKAAQLFVNLAPVFETDQTRATVYRDLPDALRAKKNVRDAYVAPSLLRGEADVVIWCGPSIDDWGPDTPQTTGIGGSETAVIAMTQRLTAAGLRVDVYNQCGPHEGEYPTMAGTSRYIDHSRFDPTKPAKLFVAWRNYDAIRLNPNAAQKWLWVHDLHLGDGFHADHAAGYDLVRPVSRWAGDHLEWLYPFLAGSGKVVPTRNGIDLARFAVSPEPARADHRMIWTSSPDRGLEHLLALWPEIRKQVPDAELHIFYGWDNIDKLINQNRDGNLLAFKQRMVALGDQPGIAWRGRVNQTTLAAEFMQAAVLPYTSHYLETNCITAAEAMAAGCVVLSTVCGAIPETTAGAAVLVMGHPNSLAYRKVYLQNLVTLLTKPALRTPWQERGRARAAQLTWEDVTADWVARLEGRSYYPPVNTQMATTA